MVISKIRDKNNTCVLHSIAQMLKTLQLVFKSNF